MYEVFGFMMWLIATDSGNSFAAIAIGLGVWLTWRHNHYL